MKSIWTALCVVALANLIAIFGFIGWLHVSGRLDIERVRRVREIISEPILAEQARLSQAEQDSKAESDAKAAEARRTLPGVSAEEDMAMRSQMRELAAHASARLHRESEDIRRAIAAEMDRLARERAALAAERQAFQQETTRRQDTASALQFRKAVGVLEGLKAPQAKLALSQLIKPGNSAAPGAPGVVGNAGNAGATVAPVSLTPSAAPVLPGPLPATAQEGKAQVIAYLNAMQDRVRTKIMDEFLKDDPALAAELLEGLRTIGSRPASASPASSPQPG